MYILVEDGYIKAISEKKLNDKFIEVDYVPSPFQIYKYIDSEFIKDVELEKEYNDLQLQKLKNKASKDVTKYIKELLNYFDYDDLADLNFCENIPMYKNEVKKIKKFILNVYKKYEKLLKRIDNGEKIDNIIPYLPRFKWLE